jgi:hypothetical protein
MAKTLQEDVAVEVVPVIETATTETPTNSNELEAQNARLRSQVSAQDKQLNELRSELTKLQTGFASALGIGEEKKELSVEELQRQISEMKMQSETAKKELDKANFIDSLTDISPVRKQELKRRIGVGEDWQLAIERENNALNTLLSEELKGKTASDTRPVVQGLGSIKQNPTANDILANPKLYRQQVGI